VAPPSPAWTNPYGQPIGMPMPGWRPRQRPNAISLQGRFCRLEPLVPAVHGAALEAAYALAKDPGDWTYMANGPFTSSAAFYQYLGDAARSEDPRHYAIVDAVSGQAMGTSALMRQDPANGVIEVGHVMYSPLLKQTPAATEAQFLLMHYVFDILGYRRYEWKCDNLNAASKRSAERLGFQFEGIFRQALVYKGRNRDTAWYSVIDGEWPRLHDAFAKWLAPDNFDANGKQRATLSALR
jgi:RimJ/RimL family protein N-acetyltransferase